MSDYEDAASALGDDYEDDFIDDEGADSDFSEVKNTKRKKTKGSKGKKKKRGEKDGRQFLDLYAAEDDEDEEGSDDEFSETEKRMAEKQRKQLQNQFRRRTEGPGFMDAYEKGANLEEYFQQAEEAGEDNELALLPTASDPKLFVVKCKPNEERDACLQVMNKYFDCLGTDAEFQIFSCTALGKTEGYIYIEAYSDKHVYVAISNIPNIFGSKITLVTFADRTQMFEADPTKQIEVKIGQWVRAKKGLYDGDLGQVEDVDDVKSRVLVKLVPRLAPENEEEPNYDDEERKAGEEKSKRGEHFQKKLDKSNVKPPQKLFQPNDYNSRIISHFRDAERGNYTLYKGKKYYDNGLLYQWFPLKNLMTQNITVTYEESKFFNVGDTSDPSVLATLIDQAGSKATKFFKGDRVKVIKGDLMNLEAEIIKISPVSLTVRSLHSDYLENLEIQPHECVKHFNKGEYVRVVEGKNAGKEGFVLSVEENIANVMSDGLQNVIQVFVNDLVFCNESTRNIEVKSKKDKEIEQEYMKFDLVKLNDRKTVGIVLGTATNGWKILDNFGNVRNVITYQIEQKLNTRNNMTKNDKAQTFRINDSVRILHGKYKGQTGIAKHIYNDLIFIYNPDVTQNMGIIIEKANNCFLLSAQRANGKPVGPKGKDTLIGQKCAIKTGPWKGYQGIVKDGNERTVRLELTSKCQIIDVKRELVIPLSEIGKPADPTEARTINDLEPKTPMINKFPQSPYFNMNSPGFENSPAWGFESPAYDAHIK